ncbi:hypothetical protein KC8_05770 [Sphingomonas sp. KC8]|nr:hypothetical protein KC8_05770 [Sphingomonas sp. KC8]
MIAMNDNPINEAAFDWLARVDAGLTSAERTELEGWLAADARHRGAYIRAKAVLSQARRIKAFAHSPDPDGWAGYIETDTQRQHDDFHEAEVARTGPVSRRAFLGAAGGVATVGLATAFLATGQAAQAFTVQTALGERRDVLLADGTRIALNTDSKLRVLFDTQVRAVELVHGEALYDVAYDEGRAFVVDAKGFRVQASEASFAVQQLPDALPQLIVRKGVVDLASADTASLTVNAPTKITFLSGNRLSRVRLSQEALDRELLWRDGKIAFDDTPLRDAIATFRRYGPVHINVEDTQLLNRTISGVFSSDDPKRFARVVAELFDLDASPEGRGIVLRRKK